MHLNKGAKGRSVNGQAAEFLSPETVLVLGIEEICAFTNEISFQDLNLSSRSRLL